MMRNGFQKSEQTVTNAEGCKNLPPSQVVYADPRDPQRQEIEAFIAKKFLKVHQARIKTFLPILLTFSQSGRFQGALGLKPGKQRPFFLEQYLDSPIEQFVASHCAQPVDRSSMIEIGNLALINAKYAQGIFVLLAQALFDAGYKWMAFTATEQVFRLMDNMGFKPQELRLAKASALSEKNQLDWGTYYTNKPRVMVGDLAIAASVIQTQEQYRTQVAINLPMIKELSERLIKARRFSGESKQ